MMAVDRVGILPAKDGDLEVIKQLCGQYNDDGIDTIVSLNLWSQTAAYNGQFEIVKYINSQLGVGCGMCTTFAAIHGGYEDIAKWLCERDDVESYEYCINFLKIVRKKHLKQRAELLYNSE